MYSLFYVQASSRLVILALSSLKKTIFYLNHPHGQREKKRKNKRREEIKKKKEGKRVDKIKEKRDEEKIKEKK